MFDFLKLFIYLQSGRFKTPEPVMEKYSHGGNIYKAARLLGCDPYKIIDLSSNVIPLKWVKKHIELKKKWLNYLPEPYSYSLIKEISDKFLLKPETIVVSSGTTELIKEICTIFSEKKAAIFYPAYLDYEKYCEVFNIETHHFPVSLLSSFKGDFDLVFICNPNNPTGEVWKKSFLEKVLKRNQNSLFVIDESYISFIEDEENHSLLRSDLKNLIVLRSFSKIYGIPGIRSGWGFCGNLSLVEVLKKRISEWSLNVVAQQVCKNLLHIDITPIKHKINKIKKWFVQNLKSVKGVIPFPSATNYILLKLKNTSSHLLFKACLNERILIRDCSNFYGLDESYIRVSVKEKSDMKKFLKVLKNTLKS